MDFRGMPSAGRHYVGLSRLTDPENLFLFDFAADCICTAPQVKAEMKRMRDGCRVQVLAPNLSNAYPASLTLWLITLGLCMPMSLKFGRILIFKLLTSFSIQRPVLERPILRTIIIWMGIMYACRRSTSSGRCCSPTESWDGHSHPRSS
jgi:hypothetical protein